MSSEDPAMRSLGSKEDGPLLASMVRTPVAVLRRRLSSRRLPGVGHLTHETKRKSRVVGLGCAKVGPDRSKGSTTRPAEAFLTHSLSLSHSSLLKTSGGCCCCLKVFSLLALCEDLKLRRSFLSFSLSQPLSRLLPLSLALAVVLQQLCLGLALALATAGRVNSSQGQLRQLVPLALHCFTRRW